MTVPGSSPWSDLDRPPLSAARLSRAVVGDLWREVRVVASTGSTNADAAAAARAGEAAGLVIIAEHQSAGRGRLDRRWEAPPRSALLLSAVLRPGPPVATWPLLPLLVGAAVAEAVRAGAGLDAVVKWPNDVLVDGRKLAGILVERVDDVVVIGVGLNVSVRQGELPVPTATSVAIAGGVTDREVLAKEILRALERRYRRWSDADGVATSVLPDYRAICSTVGADVEVSLPAGEPLRGRVLDVDDGGRLVVVDDAESLHTLSVGDVVHVRARG